MKRQLYTILMLTLIVLMTGYSCKRALDLNPEDSFGEGNFWQNEAQASNYMVGLHTQFRSNQFQFLRLGELRGGGLTTQEVFPISLSETALIDQRLDEQTTGVSNWAGFYVNILRINLFIHKVEPISSIPADKKNYLLAQAYGMRAYYYFHLLRTYGGVPLRLEPEITMGNTDPLTLRKARAIEEEVLASIKADVNKSIQLFANMPVQNKGQWNPMAVQMLKGEVYLWSAKLYADTNDLTIAKEALNSVTGFSLMSTFSEVFDYTKKKNAEIIFTISYSATEAEMGAVSLFTYDLPSIATGLYPDSLGAGTIISANPDPLNIGQPSTMQIIQRYRYSFELFQSYEAKDSRQAATFYDFYKIDKSVSPHKILMRNTVLRKYLGTFEQGKRYFSDDWPVYREADRLLMLAEIVNAEGGDPTSYIQKVRDRAFANQDPKPFVNSSKDQNELAIFAERSKEFVHEGKRWYDLRRMKFANEALVFKASVHPYGVLNKATESHKVLWPIEAAIWTRDPTVNQTAGYSSTKPN